MKPESMLYNALKVIGSGGFKRGEPGRYARQVLRRYEAIVNPPAVRPLLCNICRKTLPPDAFSVDRDKPSGRRPECRGCMKARREGAARSAQDRRAAATAKERTYCIPKVSVSEARERMARLEAGLPMDQTT